jgi:ParB family chromosome partitioning protein
LDAPCFNTKINAHIDREVAPHPELIQIENGYRAPKEQRPGAVRSGTYREVEIDNSNPDAEPVMPCEAAKPAIIVYGKRIGTTLTVCTENNCPVHDPRAAARAAENPAPVMAPAPEAETEEQAEERRQQYEAQQKAHQKEEARRAEEHREQQEREEREREAEFAKRDKLRKKREGTFERIVQEAPPVFTAPQLRVILRALVNLDPYTFADDLAEDMADENEQRSAEEVLLVLIEGTGDDKLTSFAVRLALAGHRGIPREGELDFLAEAEAVFLTPKPKKSTASKKEKPTPIKPTKAAIRTAKAKASQAPIAA